MSIIILKYDFCIDQGRLYFIPAYEGDNRSPRVALAGVHAPDVGDARADHAVGDHAVVAVGAVARCVAVRVGDDGHVGLVKVN